MGVPAMHEDVHERAGKKYEERQRCSKMRAMPDRQIATHQNGKA
jgi:hypothetical protein